GELRAAETGHEVAAPHTATLLHRPQHGIDAGEPAGRALTAHRLPGEDAVAVEQHAGASMGALGGQYLAALRACNERPATLGARRAEDRQRAGPRARRPSRS